MHRFTISWLTGHEDLTGQFPTEGCIFPPLINSSVISKLSVLYPLFNNVGYITILELPYNALVSAYAHPSHKTVETESGRNVKHRLQEYLMNKPTHFCDLHIITEDHGDFLVQRNYSLVLLHSDFLSQIPHCNMAQCPFIV
jgi:hypothetical protein